MPEKRCTRCGEVKPLEAFHVNRRSRDGFCSQCKRCKLSADKRRRDARAGERAGNGGLHRRPVGRQTPNDPAVVEYDPTGTYWGLFDRDSIAGTLFDGHWPDGMRVRMSARYRGTPSRWVVRGRVLHEVDGGRVLVATGHRDRPVLKEVE
jgi:hypothetical protein